MSILDHSQKYLATWPVTYTDPNFILLYHDVEDLAKSLSQEIFEHCNSFVFYGGRGVGKTTLMQGILLHGLEKYATKTKPFLPINVVVTGANSATTDAELEEKFYRSILEGINLSSSTASKLDRFEQMLSTAAPWIASTAISTIGLILPPVSLASGAVHEGIKKLIKRMGIANVDLLLSSKDVDAKFVVNQLIREMEEKNIIPIFTFDELDKITDDALLSSFFEGQQGWFQGKRCIVSLSFTYGDMLKDATIHSITRFCTLKKIVGVTKQSDFEEIAKKRFLLGISEQEDSESSARTSSENILPNKISTEIINNFAPHVNQMLKECYLGIQNAIKNNHSQLSIEDFPNLNDVELTKPTNIDRVILDELAKKGKTPTALAEILNKNKSEISRSLTKMKKLEWVGSEGSRTKNYFIKQKGESARHR